MPTTRVLASMLCMLCSILSSSADATTYDLQFTSPVFNISASASVDGSNEVTAFSGTFTNLTTSTSAPIVGVESLLNSGLIWTFDNLLFATDPIVTNNGIVFDAAGFGFNLYSTGSGPYSYYLSTTYPTGDSTSPNIDPGILGSLAVSTVGAVPEPSTWLLLVIGFAGLALTYSWRGGSREVEASLRPSTAGSNRAVGGVGYLSLCRPIWQHRRIVVRGKGKTALEHLAFLERTA